MATKRAKTTTTKINVHSVEESDSLVDLFPPAPPGTYFEVDNEEDELENQSYDEYKDMGKRKPNLYGTGRLKLNHQRQKVLIMYFGDSSRSSSSHQRKMECLAQYIEKFMMMEVIYEDHADAVDLNDSSLTLDSNKYDIEVTRKKKNKTKVEYKLEVFSLFDVLVHRIKAPFFSVVGLFDSILIEEGNEVMGRACGDRVACVSLPLCKPNLQTLLGTTCHELMHTIGMDHTSNHRCLMNAICQDDWLFLCVENLRKLKLFHDEAGKHSTVIYSDMVNDYDVEDEKIFFVNYHRSILNMIRLNETMKLAMKSEIVWLEKVIDRFAGDSRQYESIEIDRVIDVIDLT